MRGDKIFFSYTFWGNVNLEENPIHLRNFAWYVLSRLSLDEISQTTNLSQGLNSE